MGSEGEVSGMNDNDVIKALEACASGCCYEYGCPFVNMLNEDEFELRIDKCTSELCKHALALIKRKAAEIERLELENQKLSKTNNALNYQVDVWNPNQAIKEFA